MPMSAEEFYDRFLQSVLNLPGLHIETSKPDPGKYIRIKLGRWGPRLLNVSAGDPLHFQFMTIEDMKMLRLAPGMKLSAYGKMLVGPGGYFYESYHETVAVDPVRANPEVIANTVLQISQTTRMRQLISHQGDPDLLKLVRQYYGADDEYAHSETMNRLSAFVDESNLDKAIEAVRLIDPWTDERPDSVAGTILILLDQLIQEHRRCFSQAKPYLEDIRLTFEDMGKHGKYDIEEVDHLLQLIAQRVN